MNKIIYQNDDRIYAATTMRDITCPEANNMALHVCKDPEAILQNRKQLEKETISLDHWALPWQKHTNKSYRITQADWSRGAYTKESSIMGVDAVYTTEPQTLIGVFTADCVGLLLIDETTPCICAIHSGWKGTVQAITDKTVHQLLDEHLLHPESTRAYFSPSLQFETLEVGLEVVDQLKENHIDMDGCIQYMPNHKAYIDNQGMNIKMLEKYGITHIYPSTYDTKPDPHCFSYRRDGKTTGEHFTFAYIKNKND